MKPANAIQTALEEGRALRKRVPRSSLALWKAPAKRGDPITLLLQTGQHRLAHLLPLRYSRMSQSAFAFMRGSAAIMARDLAATPVTGLQVQACGDCHLANFGAFASPERRVVFDITDFDETLAAPWEYDLKRLAASFILFARSRQLPARLGKEVVRQMVRSYRDRLNEFARLSPLEVWYFILDSGLLTKAAPDRASRESFLRFEQAAHARGMESLLGKLLTRRKGEWRFAEQPPILARLRKGSGLEHDFLQALKRYPRSLSNDRRQLLGRYKLVDLAFKVVGVGSVGTRCAVALYTSESGDPLVLQVKQALPSVLDRYSGPTPFAHQGERVVVGQRLMQCASDIFLGWASDDDGHDYYVRQLRDMKASFPLDGLASPILVTFASVCGWALARAHAKSGPVASLAGYLGRGEQADNAIVKFAVDYADQCESDYARFLRAIRDGRVPIQPEKSPRPARSR